VPLADVAGRTGVAHQRMNRPRVPESGRGVLTARRQQLAEACVRSSGNDGNSLDDDRIDAAAALALQPVRHGEHEANRTSPLLRDQDDRRLDLSEDRTVFLEEGGFLERLEQKAAAKTRDGHRVDSAELFVDA